MSGSLRAHFASPRPLAGIVLCFLACALAAPAPAVVFDFEELEGTTVPAFGNQAGLVTSVTSARDGIALTLTRSGGVAFDLGVVGPPDWPASWGSIVVDPFFADTQDDYFLANFSVAVSSVSVALTDFGDDADEVELLAYAEPDAAGAPVASDSASWSAASSPPDFVTVSASAEAIRSVLFRGGSPSFPNSMFADNVEVVPEPSAGEAALVALGAAALRRRERRTPRGGCRGVPRNAPRRLGAGRATVGSAQ